MNILQLIHTERLQSWETTKWKKVLEYWNYAKSINSSRRTDFVMPIFMFQSCMLVYVIFFGITTSPIAIGNKDLFKEKHITERCLIMFYVNKNHKLIAQSFFFSPYQPSISYKTTEYFVADTGIKRLNKFIHVIDRQHLIGCEVLSILPATYRIYLSQVLSDSHNAISEYAYQTVNPIVVKRLSVWL